MAKQYEIRVSGGKHYPFHLVDTRTNDVVALERTLESAERASEFWNALYSEQPTTA